MKQVIAALIVLLASPGAAFANEPEVVKVVAFKEGDAWRFDVTVAHDDDGWEHYADAWRVVGPDGEVYGMRVLAHPHDDERPFTRSLSGISIPIGVASVEVSAKDKVHGWGAPLAFVLP